MGKLRIFFRSILILLPGLLVCNCSCGSGEQEKINFYVGSSNGSLEHSIFLCELDPGTSQLTVIDSFPGARGPSYLTISGDKKYLYTINREVSDPAANQNTVTSFRINPENHSLELMNSQSSEGAGPCHVHCSRKGTFLFTANYTSGSVAAFPLTGKGEIQPASSVALSSGSGPVEGRQEGPHTHYVSLDPDENYLLSPDLGSDKVLVYEFDHDSGILTPNPEQPFINLAPGSGPRHLVFHPTGEFLYVVNELDATVTACSFNDKNGTLTKLNTVGTLPDSYSGSKYPAAIRIDPEGNFLYASTRGERGSIAVFRVEDNGRIHRIQVVEEVPAWPRDFNIEPEGNYLLVAGERSDKIQLFLIDQETGLLTATDHILSVPAPGCILFID